MKERREAVLSKNRCMLRTMMAGVAVGAARVLHPTGSSSDKGRGPRGTGWGAGGGGQRLSEWPVV